MVRSLKHTLVRDTLRKLIYQMLGDNATIAQLVEHLTCNEDVPGSIPGGGSKIL